MPIIVDGYNLLRSVQKSYEELEFLDEASMCMILSEYLHQKRTHGHVVFDGLGPPDKTALGGIGDLEVYFSGMEIDADTIIMEKIEDNTAPKSLIVVSSDREIRTAAKKRKAISVQSDIFWVEVMKQLNRKKTIPEPKEKRQGITDGETDQWMDLFGLDK